MVALAILATPVLVMLGLVGRRHYPEVYQAKQVLVTPASDGEGVTIREVVDDDFGTTQRHGYQRYIPNDFGAPINVSATSPDAPADLDITDLGDVTRIRLGDPSRTISGQHRYVLTYTLPKAQLSTGKLALDIIGTDDVLETQRFEVVLSGFVLDTPLCNVGGAGASGGCTLAKDGVLYRTVIAPLAPNTGITVGGTISKLVTPLLVDEPAPVGHRTERRWPLAMATALLGLLAGGAGYLVATRLGRNEVAGSSAADAAYVTAPRAPTAPGAPATPPPAPPTRLVTDKQLEAMSTTEFAPPEGIRPWQGRLLLREQIDLDSMSAWFGDQIAQEYFTLTGKGTTDDPQILGAGPKLHAAPPVIRDRIVTLLGSDTSTLTLGKYEPRLATLWDEIRDEQRDMAAQSGWWKKFPPGTNPSFPALLGIAVAVAVVVVILSVWRGWVQHWPIALVLAIGVPAAVAGSAYRTLLPVRSAVGSALALRTESFRKFLKASEGTHVDWAWQHGLLREYSAWAVALGAADAWGRAVANSTVPPQQLAMHTGPLLFAASMTNFSSTFTPPPSPSHGGGGGFSGGGFSGGGVGFGGGGGSSGNW
jgi:uncharacterized membrane protein YgcG